MGLNIKLLVHGVPHGQKKWGAAEDDSRYLCSFYVPKWEVPEVMKVEVVTFGADTCCYYTFLKGVKVYGSDGRLGSYIALTLRVNAFYVDVGNIYNVLKAAYEKMCVGHCVSDDGQYVKYLVADFKDVTSQLEQIERYIIDYISAFSVDSDVISFSQLKLGKNETVKNVNLAECTSQVALDTIQHFGPFFVSPYFLSASASAKIAQYKETMLIETNRVKENSQCAILKAHEQLAAIKEAAQKGINLLHEQSEQEKNSLKKQHEQEISNFEVERENLKKKIKDREMKLQAMQKSIDAYKELYQKDLMENEQFKEQKCQKQRLIELHPTPISNRQKIKVNLNRKILFVSVIFLFILMLLGGMYFCLSRNIRMNEENKSLKSQVETLECQIKKMKVKRVKQNTKESKEKYKLDIKEFTRQTKYALKDQIITIRVKPTPIPNGKIECKGLKVKGNKITATKKGDFTIVYTVDGKEITHRNIEVK